DRDTGTAGDRAQIERRAALVSEHAGAVADVLRRRRTAPAATAGIGPSAMKVARGVLDQDLALGALIEQPLDQRELFGDAVHVPHELREPRIVEADIRLAELANRHQRDPYGPATNRQSPMRQKFPAVLESMRIPAWRARNL